MSSVLAAVDSLFEMAVMSPGALTDQAISDWMEGVASSGDLDKRSAKYLRRLVRTARSLASFWESDVRAGDPGLDWRTRVDIAMGPRAWRPVLELSQYVLVLRSSEEVFDSVRGLFRLVNGGPWLEGMSYEEWREEH